MTKRCAIGLAICLTALPSLARAQDPPTLPVPTPIPPMVDVAMPLPQTPAPVPTPPPPTKGPSGQGPTGQAPRGTPPAQPGAKPDAQTPTATPQTLMPKKIRGRDVNVQVEITITETQGSGPGEKRVVSMLVADAAFGRIRSTATQDVKLNIDATPTLLDNDRIALELTIEYLPVTPEGASRRPAGLLEMLTVILQNGKPLLISQAADPTIDRRITLEVRASVMK